MSNRAAQTNNCAFKQGKKERCCVKTPLRSIFAKHSCKKENKVSTFEEKVKLFVTDDREQWLSFKRQLNEAGIVTNVGVQEHLAMFVQAQVSEMEKETHDIDKPNIDEKEKRNISTHFQRLCSKTFSFATSENEESSSSIKNIQRHMEAKAYIRKGNQRMSSQKAQSEKIQRPTYFRMGERLEKARSFIVGLYQPNETPEPVYIRRCTVVVNQETQENERYQDSKDDIPLIVPILESKPKAAREIYSVRPMNIDAHLQYAR
mmetsp:Transcript_51994/g.62543  ORF Transcript_51994/g.62543 Transcript_51994/m.62543 type:complete len:261 (+) Transcript_51994:84-866(+)